MTRRRLSLAVALPLLAGLACSDKKGEKAAVKPGNARVLIGATLPLSGDAAKPGAMYKQGYQLAIDEVNRRGGLDLQGVKVPVELVVRDDQTQVDQVTAMTRKLLDEDKVDFLLGTYTSALNIKGPVGNNLPRTYIHCTTPSYAALQGSRNWVKAQQGWRWAEIATGHDAMVMAPEELTRMLIGVTS